MDDGGVVPWAGVVDPVCIVPSDVGCGAGSGCWAGAGLGAGVGVTTGDAAGVLGRAPPPPLLWTATWLGTA